MECIPDFIYFKDTRSRFIRCSRALLRRFGVASNTEVVGKSDFDFIAPEDARAAFAEEAEIVRTGRPVIGRIHTRTFPEEGLLWRLTSKMPWRDHVGNIIGTLGVTKDITDIKRAELEIERMHRRLVEVSRRAGMAEVAESVLHGIGNALNSVQVSATLALDLARGSKIGGLAKLDALLQEHRADLPGFFSNDPRGQQIPAYLTSLTQALLSEQREAVAELQQLQHHVAHIERILSVQQRYARFKGVSERFALGDVLDDALHLVADALATGRISVERAYADTPMVTLERHKLLHIVVALLDHARSACERSSRTGQRITLRVAHDSDRGRITCVHTGAGFPPDHAAALFAQALDTSDRPADLHNAALLAKELGGTLTAHSDGPDTGSTLTLDLPIESPTSSPQHTDLERSAFKVV